MNILNRAKYRMVLNNDCLTTEYDMETEFNGTMIMNISYDYVQDHFTNLPNPVKVYQNKIVKIGSDEAKALYPSIPIEIEGTFYEENSMGTDAPAYRFSEGEVELAGNDCYKGTYTIEEDFIKIKYYEYTPPVEEPEPFDGEETLWIQDENTLYVEKTTLYEMDDDYECKYMKDLY